MKAQASRAQQQPRQIPRREKDISVFNVFAQVFIQKFIFFQYFINLKIKILRILQKNY